MNDKLTFGQLLTKLLTITNITGKNLAKAINVDSSVVSRWKTGKRKIPYNSNYLELISTYLSQNITTTVQQNIIKGIAVELDVPIIIVDSNDIKGCIYNILLVAQQKSNAEVHIIETKNNLYNDGNTDSDFKENITINTDEINSIKSHKCVINKTSYKHKDKSNDSHKTYELIIGHENIINAGIKLLESAVDKSCYIDEPIIVTFFTELDSFCNFEDTYEKWYNVLIKLLSKDFNIKHLIRLNENMNRNLKIIDNIKIHTLTKKYSPYYIRNYNLIPVGTTEFIIVPSVGVLMCIGAHNKTSFDSAILYRDVETINIFRGLVNQAFDHSNPLIGSCKDLSNGNNILNEIINIEYKTGDSYLLKDTLSIKTMPLDIYKNKLLQNKRNLSHEKIAERLSIQEKRNENFYKHLENYNSYNIYKKSSIENFIKTGNFGIANAPALDQQERVQCLKNVISLLEKYDNFHIALLNDNHKLYFNDLFWSVKDYEAAIMYFKDLPSTNNIINKYLNLKDCSKKNHVSIIYEPIILNSFKKYFMNILDEISPVNKDKESVISWLKKQIKSIE